MADICSIISYHEVLREGYIGKRQAQYLSVFIDTRRALTHHEASQLVNKRFDIRVPARNGRIAELESLGFIEKTDKVRCTFTGKLVNRWKWTGRMAPAEQRVICVTCPQCQGTGRVYQKVIHQRQLELEMKGQP